MTVTALTPIAIQFAPDAEVVMTTWADFRRDNRDAFTGDELADIADELADGEPVIAGWALIWIAA